MTRMSADNVKLAPKAEKDLSKILRYTGKIWGEAQLKRYRGLIQRGFDAIEQNPEIGSATPFLPHDCRALTVGTHSIVYRILDDRLEIARILHQRMTTKLI